MNNINSKLFVISQYLLSAIILVLAFKHQMEILLMICVIISVAMGMIFINEFGNDRTMLSFSMLEEFIVLIVTQGFLEYHIVTDFTFLRLFMFLLNILAYIIYFYYLSENFKRYKWYDSYKQILHRRSCKRIKP